MNCHNRSLKYRGSSLVALMLFGLLSIAFYAFAEDDGGVLPDQLPPPNGEEGDPPDTTVVDPAFLSSIQSEPIHTEVVRLTL